MYLRELDLVNDVLVCVPLLFASRVLWYFFDLNLSVLRDNLLHIELKESIEASNLLGDQSVLLEVGLDHGPCIFRVDHFLISRRVIQVDFLDWRHRRQSRVHCLLSL